MTTDAAALQERMRSEIGYAVRTAAAHGYAKGKRGTDYGGTINALIENAATAVMSVVAPAIQAAKAEAWDEGHSWGWSDAQDAHDVRQFMDRADWPICTPNPHKENPNE